MGKGTAKSKATPAEASPGRSSNERASAILTRLLDATNEIESIYGALDAEEGPIMDGSAVRRLDRLKSGLFEFIERNVDLLDATPADLPWTDAARVKAGA